MDTEFLQAPDLSESTPLTFWVLEFESQFSCMLGKCATAELYPHPCFPSMPWKQLPVLRILAVMSSPVSAYSKEPASSETEDPLTQSLAIFPT